MQWFVVRTFVRVSVKGRPRFRDHDYRPGVAGVEERLVLLRARNHAAALRRGEAEARSYAKGTATVNVYGQRVVARVLDFAESYELTNRGGNGRPDDGDEVFSSIENCDAKESPARIIARKVGVRGPPAAAMFVSGRLLRRMVRECAADRGASARADRAPRKPGKPVRARPCVGARPVQS